MSEDRPRLELELLREALRIDAAWYRRMAEGNQLNATGESLYKAFASRLEHFADNEGVYDQEADHAQN